MYNIKQYHLGPLFASFMYSFFSKKYFFIHYDVAMSSVFLYIFDTPEYCDVIKVLLRSKFSDHVARSMHVTKYFDDITLFLSLQDIS